MKRTIAIAFIALALAQPAPSAQTADERARIFREFEQRVAGYRPQHVPAGRIFTPPVAVVFRQLIATTLAERHVVAINGDGTVPQVLADALPPLPRPLEYRLIGRDLVIHDKETAVIVAVLRDAVGKSLTAVR